MKRYTRKAQALVEIGILGSVVLITLGMMCTFIARMNVDQYILMESFRRSLKKAHDENECIGYGMWDDRRMVDINQPIIGNKNAHSGAGFVMWSIPSVLEGAGGGGSGESGGGGDSCNVQDCRTGGEDPDDSLYVAINSPPGMMYFNEYEVQGGSGGIKPDYLTFTVETINVSTSGHSTSSGRASGVGEVMHYEIGDSNHVYQGRGYGGGRGLGASN